jgi:hypothetical protein
MIRNIFRIHREYRKDLQVGLMHSTREFVLGSDWIEAYAQSCIYRERLFQCAVVPANYTESRCLVTQLLRSEKIIPSELRKRLESSFSLKADSLIQYVERVNRAVGQYFCHRHGYRDHPLLVLSRNYPWASFFSPISNVRPIFRDHVTDAIEFYRSRSMGVDFLIGAIAVILIICHPFIDCNGRTARIVVYNMLVKYMSLQSSSAAYYADKFSGENSSFIISFWEAREQGNFGGIADILK